MIGALPYMAPEMIENPRAAGAPSDVWAIGALLFEMLCGEKPYGTGLRAVPNILKASPPNMPELLTKNPQFSLWLLEYRQHKHTRGHVISRLPIYPVMVP